MVRSIALSTAAMLVLGSVLLAATSTGVQPEPAPAPGEFRLERTIFMESAVAWPSASAVTVSAVSLTLAPGARTTPFANAGPVVVSVREGTVHVSRAASGPWATDGPAPRPILRTRLQSPDQVMIPAGTQVLLHNAGSESAWLMVVALMPQPV